MREGFYKGYRFSIEIIRHCVWLYCRFSLSLRDISEMMAYRGIAVGQETVRQRALIFRWSMPTKSGVLNQNLGKPGTSMRYFLRSTVCSFISGVQLTNTVRIWISC